MPEREAVGMAVPTIFASAWVRRWAWVGMSRNQAAARFKVSVASAVRWVKWFQTTGEISWSRSGDRRSGRIEAHHDYLLGLVRRSRTYAARDPERIANCGQRWFAVLVLWRFFDRHAIIFKKNGACRGATTRRRPKSTLGMVRGQLDLDPTKLVFIDETGASTNLARKSGRCGAGAACGRPSRTVTTKR